MSVISRQTIFQHYKTIKIVIVGCSGVGKTSISNRFVYNQFDSRMSTTLGAAYLQKIIQIKPKQIYKLQIWDTAGQQKYRSIAKIYYKQAKAAIMVYDISDKISFQGMKSWTIQVKNVVGSETVLAVVGNKMDLIQEEDIEEVGYEQVKAYAEEIGAMFKLVSAKSKKGIDQLFLQIAQKAINIRNTEQGEKLTVQKSRKKKCCIG